MRHLLILAALLIFASAYNKLHTRRVLMSKTKNTLHQMCEGSDETEASESDGSTNSWSNPAYPKEELNLWWNAIDRSLMSIGSKGVQQSHVNSILELLKSHERVRVKIASDKLDSVSVAKDLCKSEILEKDLELLQCRPRAFMVWFLWYNLVV